MRPPIHLPSDTLGFRDLSFAAIRRWRLVFVGALGLLVLGALAWVFVPLLEEPRIDVPGLTVTMIYPGASPEDVELQVVKPVEESLYELPDIEHLEVHAVPGVAFFNLRFAGHIDMDVMTEKARGKVMGRKPDLPPEVKDPTVIKWTTASVPQMVIAVTGLASDLKLGSWARRLKSSLAAVPGVAGVDLRGEHRPAVRVRIDPVRLAQHHVTPEQVVRQLRLSNVRIPGGSFEVGPLSTLLQVNNELANAAAVAQVPIAVALDQGGARRTINLSDVAEVRDATRTTAERFVYNRTPAVGLEIRFRGGEDAVAVGRAVRAHVAGFAGDLPPGVRAVICQDQPAWIQASVRGFIESLLEGIALVMLVTTLGMGLRAGLVVSAVIPLSVGGAVLGLYLLGYSLETVSIGGLIVALGLLVDDAVVVTESVQIMRDKGLSALRAAVFGTARVFWANNGTTMVAIASFLPLFAMSGDIGAYIQGLPMAVILSLLTSLLVAQIFTPWVSTFFLKKPVAVPEIADATPYSRHDDRIEGSHAERNPALRILRRLYARMVPGLVAHPRLVVLGFVLLLVASFGLFRVIDVEFFPKADKGVLFVTLELPKGTRLERVAEKLVAATQLLQAEPAVADTSAVIGGSYPLVFSSRFGPARGSHIADMLVRLRPGADSAHTAIRLRQRLADLVGVKTTVDELSFGPPVVHPILIRVFGEEHAKLRSIADEIRARLATIPGAINISDSLSESVPLAKIHMDADAALRYGVTPAQIGQTLRWLYGEDKVTDFRLGDELVEVVLERVVEPQQPFASLEETPIPAGAAMVPLKQIGSADLGHGFAQLERRNTRRMVEIWADVSSDTPASRALGQIDTWLRARPWERGYGFAYGGEQEETDKSFRALGIAAIGALLLIFLLLLLMFDSLRLAALVIIAVPFALLGALPGLALTGNAFGFMAFLGLIALVGVYVNHKIYFVDRMLELMRRGDDLPTAILHAGQDRLRPVVLTALTALLGLLPLTLGGGRMWSSFGWVNIFGLAASIPLSLVLLPALILASSRASYSKVARQR